MVKSPIIKPIRGDKPALMIRNRLSNLAQSFSGFEQQIQQIKTKKKDDDQHQMITIQRELQSITNDLNSETKKREETVKAVESMFTNEINQVKNAVQVSVYSKIDALIESIHHLSNKLSDMETQQEKDRINFPSTIDQKSSDLMKQLNHFKARFEADIAERQHKEKTIEKIIDEQNFHVRQMLEAERVEREKKIMSLQNDLDLEIRMRSKSCKAMKETHKENMDHLNMRVDNVRREREESTCEVVKALVHYTAALHDGVTIVSEAG